MNAPLSTDRDRPEALIVAEELVAPRSGDVIAGKYTVKGLIGRGGVGDIYLASRTGGKRDIVLKMLSDRWLGDSDAVARFEREATRLRSIEHPNIVVMHDSGVDRGRPFLVMEFIDGEPLSAYLSRRGRLCLEDFVPIAAQVLKGMGHAHLREMMIRDVKPSNIMLCTRKGRCNYVKLLDFGLAKFTRDEAPLTEGYVLGTAGYLAPEAIKGEPLDVRVDVYAIGVLFYHMLSGVRPFQCEENAAVLYKTINEIPPPLAEILPQGHGIPDALLELISDCLEKAPDDRPSDANIVVERLIDAVPASYFRLPTAQAIARVPGFGNTGLMELLRANPSVELAAIGSTQPGQSQKRRPRVSEWALIFAIASVASLGTAMVFSIPHWSQTAQHEDRSPVTAAAASASSPHTALRSRVNAPRDAPSPQPRIEPASIPRSPPQQVRGVGNTRNETSFVATPPLAAAPELDSSAASAPKLAPRSLHKRRKRLVRAPATREKTPIATKASAPAQVSPSESAHADAPRVLPTRVSREPRKRDRSVFLSAERDETASAREGLLAVPTTQER